MASCTLDAAWKDASMRSIVAMARQSQLYLLENELREVVE
jgi:hypothetical protein